MRYYHLIYFIVAGYLLGGIIGGFLLSLDANATWIGGSWSSHSMTGFRECIEWQYDKNITGVVNEFHLATNVLFTSGGTYDLDKVYLMINNNLIGTPSYADSSYDFDSYWKAIVWANLNLTLTNVKPLIEIDFDAYGAAGDFAVCNYCDLDNDGDTNYRFSNSDTYFNGSLDGQTSITSQDVVYALKYVSGFVNLSDVLSNYDELFGNTYIQFMNYDELCEYRIGDTANLVYSVNNSVFGSESGFIYSIIDVTGDVVHNGLITFTNSSINGSISTSYVFNKASQYQIRLYNITTNLTKNQLIFTSQVMTVCQESEETPPVTEETETEIASDVNLILGLFVSIGMGLGMFIITKSAYIFLAVTSVTSYALSINALGTYQLLPVEVSIAIIVIMVLVAVIIWLMD